MTFGKNFAMNHISDIPVYSENTATVRGVGMKTVLLLLCALASCVTLIGYMLEYTYLPLGVYIFSVVGVLVVQLIMIFKATLARFLAIPYAIMEGLTVGCICGLLELALPGYGLQISSVALVFTLCIFLACLILYSTNVIKVGYKFMNFVLVASLGFALFMIVFFLLSLVMRFTTGHNVLSYFFLDKFMLIISIVMCVFATLYVLMSIANAHNMVERGMEKVYEWYAAYSITLNVIYLFVEVLRLLLILLSRARDNQ